MASSCTASSPRIPNPVVRESKPYIIPSAGRVVKIRQAAGAKPLPQDRERLGCGTSIQDEKVWGLRSDGIGDPMKVSAMRTLDQGVVEGPVGRHKAASQGARQG